MLDRLKDAALAALAGAGDEASFGLEGKYWPAAKKIIEDNPRMASVGRVGSYFLPVAGELEALRGAMRAGEAAKGAGSLLKLANLQGLLQHGAATGVESLASKVPGLAAKEGGAWIPEVAKAAGKGAVSAVGAGEGNSLVRKGLGTDDGASPDIGSMAEAGAAGGAIGRVLQGAAQGIYSHPALMNKYKPEQSAKQAQALMDDGVWGGLGTFKNKADELKGVLDQTRGKLLTPIQKARTGIQPLLDAVNKKNSSFATEDPEARALVSSVFDKIQDLGPDGNLKIPVGNADSALKEVNTELKGLSQRQQGQVWGGGGQGDVPGRIDRLLTKRQGLSDILDHAIGENGSPSDLSEWQGAKDTYRRGADLGSNINRFEGAEMTGSPHVRSLHHAILNHTIGAAPVRTGLGVLANEATPEVAGGIAGELSGLGQRGDGTAQPPPQEDNIFLKDIQSAPAPKPPGKTGNIFLDDLGQ